MTLHLEKPARPPDWQDRYSGPLLPPDMAARTAFERGLDALPGWVTTAMSLRNALMRPFGLHRPTGYDKVAFLAALPVAEAREDVFETGLTDRHLTFTLRVETEPGRVTARTLIWFEHWTGRLYLRLVWPVHHLLMRRMVASLGSAS